MRLRGISGISIGEMAEMKASAAGIEK